MRKCSLCGQDPVPFETAEGATGYFVFSWKGDTGLVHLMSDGDIKFGVALEVDPHDERFNYYCMFCVEKMQEEDSTNE